MAKHNHNNDKATWKVCAGEGGFLAEEFRDKNCIAVGWEKLGNLNDLQTRQQLLSAAQNAYPELSVYAIGGLVGMALKFRNSMKPGDRVIVAFGSTRTYIMGTISGEYEFRPDYVEGMTHILQVEWESKTVKRDHLSQATKFALGGIGALYQVRDSAAKEVEEVLLKGAPVDKEPDADSEGASELSDAISKAFDIIKNDIVLKLEWDQMQELVAGILRAMGYKTRVSKAGADLGKDIIASPDGLGFEEPRIVVEVKHRTGSIGAPILRSFIGGLGERDCGLYVSTSGFTKEATYEAARSNPSVTLLDIDALLELLFQYYELVDGKTRSLVPLVRVYWPAIMADTTA